MKDYYTILGIERNASKEDIKKAFHKIAHKYHPDKTGGDATKFKEASEAYAVLSDDKKRNEYDSYGQVFSEARAGGAGNNGGFSGFDFSGFGDAFKDFEDLNLGDIFGDIFSGGFTGQGGRNRAMRGKDISIDIELPFTEAIFGTERTVLLSKTSACETCAGSGAKAGTDLTTCPSCNGNGKIRETRKSFLGSFTSVHGCETCNGSGRVPKEKCATCKGVGVRRKQEEISIVIPVGIENGEMIRLTGAGEAIPRGTPGDLYVKVHVHPHQVFKKEGTNLLMDIKVKLTDALLGASYTVKTLDGDIELKVPEGISHGEVLRVRGKGVPIDQAEGSRTVRRGDLLAHVKIELPRHLSKKAKEALERLREEGI